MSFRTSLPFLKPKRRRVAANSTRFSHRLGPIQLTVSSRPTGYYLRVSVYGTGLWWEQRLRPKGRPSS